MPIEVLKLNLIKKIMEVDDPSTLEAMDAAMESIWHTDDEDVLHKLAKPMRKKLDIEELKRAQHWKPIDKEGFFKKMEDLDIQEPLEELIAMI